MCDDQREVALPPKQQRVAVRRRVGDRFGRDRAIGAGPCFNDDRFAPKPFETLRDEPREAIALAPATVPATIFTGRAE